MKTKIIYISGDEIFNIADIRAAFDAVREALQLDKNTILFGVPVDKEDAGLGKETDNIVKDDISHQTVSDDKEQLEIIKTVVETKTAEDIDITSSTDSDKPKQKRGRTRKNTDNEKTVVTSDIDNDSTESNSNNAIPILSVLSVDEIKHDQKNTEPEEDETVVQDVAITDNEIPTESIETKSEVLEEVISDIKSEPETENLGEPDLEKLLSSMQPLQEDVLEDDKNIEILNEVVDDTQDDDVDATLEKLATEFVETQDKIASATKSSTRSKIGKLRNILPFKQSKHKDQGLDNLFGWAGEAANDDGFSVPGFFTNANSKK